MLATLLRTAAALAVSALATTATAQDFYKMGTLPPGSSIYTINAGFAQAINRHVPNSEVQINASGSAAQHMLAAAQGEMDFFMSSTLVYHHMANGTGMYSKIANAPELSENLRGIFNFPVGAWHALVFADSGIENYEDIKNKTVFLGPPSGGSTLFTQQIVEGATGYIADQDFTVAKVGFDAAQQSFQDRRIDVLIFPSLVPGGYIQQLVLTNEMRMLSFTPEQLAKPAVMEALSEPGRTQEVIPAGIYGENLVNEGEIQTVGSWIGVGARAGLNEEFVYQATKAFWENIDELHAQGPGFRDITIESALREFNMPLHSGAQRY